MLDNTTITKWAIRLLCPVFIVAVVVAALVVVF